MFSNEFNKEDLWGDITEIYFPGKSILTTEINKILTKLYSSKLKNNFENLEKIVINNDTHKDITKIAEISKNIFTTQELFVELNSFQYASESTELIRNQFEFLNEKFIEKLEYSSFEKYLYFQKLNSELRKNKNNINNLRDLRKRLNVLDEYLFLHNDGLYDVIKMHYSYKIPEEIMRFHQEKPNINILENDMNFLLSRYKNIYSSSNPIKELKKIIKETKRGIFKSKLISKYIFSEYYEGVLILYEINKESKLILKNFDDYLDQFKKITNDTSLINLEISRFASSNIYPIEKRIELLKKLHSTFKLDKYKDNSLILKVPITKYISASSKLNKKVVASLNEAYLELKNQSEKKERSEQELKKLKYDNNLKNLQNKIIDLQSENYKQEKELTEKEEAIRQRDISLQEKEPKKYVSLNDKLRYIESPLDSRLFIISDILEGRKNTDGWIDRISLLKKEIDKLATTKDLIKTDYVVKVHDALSDFYVNGYLGEIASFSKTNKEIIEGLLDSIYSFGNYLIA